MTDELKPCPFDVWIDREVETGVTYFNNLVAGLGPWSDKREKHIRNQMRLAFEAGMNTRPTVRPAVKALVWNESPQKEYLYFAQGGGWTYKLEEVRLGYWAVDCGVESLGVFPSAKEAKAAAQADYERRVLSCLEDTPADPWLPIETAPKDGTQVLLNGISDNTGRRFVAHCYYDEAAECWRTADDGSKIWERNWTFTGWMPLPTPPTQEEV